MDNLPKKIFSLLTKDPIIQKLVIDTFRYNDIPVHEETNEFDPKFPYLTWDGATNKSLTQYHWSLAINFLSLEDFMAEFGIGTSKSVEVKLNEKHSAVVTYQGIEVGGQKFTHDVIKKLYEASCKIQDSKK